MSAAATNSTAATAATSGSATATNSTSQDKDKKDETQISNSLLPCLLSNVQFERVKTRITLATSKGPATFQMESPLRTPLIQSGPKGGPFKHYLVLTPTNFILYVEPAHPNWLYLWDINESKAGRLAFHVDLVALQAICTPTDYIIIISTAFSIQITTLSNMLVLYRKNPKLASSMLADQVKVQMPMLAHSEMKKPLLSLAPSPHAGYVLLATLGEKPGDIAIVSIPHKPTQNLEQIVIKQPHLEELVALELSSDGHFLATASQRGTMIRVWDTSSGKMTHEFRRGRRGAQVQSMSFSPDSKWLAVGSDHHTVHLFAIELQSANKGSSYLMAAMTLSTSTMFAAATYNFAEYSGFEGLQIQVHMDNSRIYVYFPHIHALHLLNFDVKQPSELKEFPWWKEKVYAIDAKRPEKDPYLEILKDAVPALMLLPDTAAGSSVPGGGASLGAAGAAAGNDATSNSSSSSTIASNASTITNATRTGAVASATTASSSPNRLMNH